MKIFDEATSQQLWTYKFQILKGGFMFISFQWKILKQ